MAHRIVQVDAFTATPFAGNPAAVCVLPAAAPPEWMQSIAREMNVAETAFLVPRDGDFDRLARCLDKLAALYRARGDEAKARKHEQRAAALRKKVDPDNVSGPHPNWGQRL